MAMKLASKTAIIAFLSLSLLLLFTSCSNQKYNPIDYKEEYRLMNIVEKNRYGSAMGFHFRMFWDGEMIITQGMGIARFVFETWDEYFFDPFYTDLIFVHNEQEALAFPDNIITAWPRDDIFTEGLLAGIHWAAGRNDEDLIMHNGRPQREALIIEDFGLSYPLTATDLVDNWEKVRELWNAFHDNERATILRAAPVGGPRE